MFLGGTSMRHLSDQQLIKTHSDAVLLRLDPDFIALLEKEMKKRGLSVPDVLSRAKDNYKEQKTSDIE